MSKITIRFSTEEMAILTDRERLVVGLLLAHPTETMAEIGKKMHVCRDRVRQIKNLALRRVKAFRERAKDPLWNLPPRIRWNDWVQRKASPMTPETLWQLCLNKREFLKGKGCGLKMCSDLQEWCKRNWPEQPPAGSILEFIHNTELSVRAANVIWNNYERGTTEELRRDASLVKYPSRDKNAGLLKFRNCGLKTAREIQRALGIPMDVLK